ncbi:sialic acid-binding Ig-like lectin 13 [Rhynchonycteris naso]
MVWLLLPLLWAGSLAQDPGYSLRMLESVTVQEGLCVSVPCTISYPQKDWTDRDPAWGYWKRIVGSTDQRVLVATNKPRGNVLKEAKGRFYLLGDPQSYNCSLYIRDARRTDSGSYVFRVERGESVKYTYSEPTLSVHVTALSHTPDILIPRTMEAGRPVNLTCSVPWACERGTPPLFSWMSADHPTLVPSTHLSPVLTLTPQIQDHGAILTCEVTLPGASVTTKRTIHLNVSYTSQNLVVTVFQGNGTAPTILENGSSLYILEGQTLYLEPRNPSEMVWLLLPLLWAGSLAQDPGYSLRMLESVTVQEGLCVSVPCTISYPKKDWTDRDPAWGYWKRIVGSTDQRVLVATNKPRGNVLKEAKGRFYLLGDPRSYNCSLYIRDTRRTDSGSYVFRVERGESVKYTYKEPTLSVHVTALSHTPDILIPRTMEAGRPVNLTCSVPWACERGTPPIFSWMSADHPTLVPSTHLSPVLTFTPRIQDHGATLTCEVTLPGASVTTKRTIHLNVSYIPQNLVVTVFQGNGTAPTVLENGSSLSILEGQSLRLVCVVDCNPPARLSWTRGSLTLSSSKPGVLELPRIHIGDEGEFTCRAQHSRGFLHVSLTLSLQRKTWALSGATLGAVGGAGLTTLLFLSFCVLVVIVRSCRKKRTKTVLSTENAGMEGANAVTRSISQGPLIKSPPDSPADYPPPALVISSLGEKEEIQYASLRFHKTKPGNPLKQEEVTDNEYSEVNIGK